MEEEKSICTTCKCSVLGLGVAIGVLWGAGVLLLGLMATYANWGNAMVEVLGSIYLKYDVTLVGSLIGTVWALVDGFIAGAIIAFVYNLVAVKK